MPRFSDWNHGGSSKSSGDSSLFKRLDPGKHKVRLISKPLEYMQFFEVDGKRIICRSPYQDENGVVVCPLMQLGKTPRQRYSIWIFDRDENNTLKIMDFPPSLFDYFKEWWSESNEEPGGPKGCDWRIIIEAPTASSQYKKYKAMPLERTPFTPEEITQIKEGNLKNRLLDVRRDNTPDEIREMMIAAGIGQAVQPQVSHESRVPDAPAHDAVAASPSEPVPVQSPKLDDDDMDW